MADHCFKCGVSFDDLESIILVGGNKYHKACSVELICETCNKTIEYLDGTLESNNYKISCVNCSKI